MNDTNELHLREKSFHDAWASAETLDSVHVDAAFENCTAPENQFILKLLGDLRGKRVLDVGCGLGEASIYFSKCGAVVTALDISPEMTNLCMQNANRFGLNLEAVVSIGEDLKFPSESFDVVYAANVIHHIHDRETFLSEVKRILKPGGLFVAWDPLKYNPVINVYRRLASKVRTEDESPLGVNDLLMTRGVFPNARWRSFWLFSLLIFLKYFFIDRRDPNQTRYWKQVLSEDPKQIRWWFTPLQFLDGIALRIPLCNLLAWNVVQYASKCVSSKATPDR